MVRALCGWVFRDDRSQGREDIRMMVSRFSQTAGERKIFGLAFGFGFFPLFFHTVKPLANELNGLWTHMIGVRQQREIIIKPDYPTPRNGRAIWTGIVTTAR